METSFSMLLKLEGFYALRAALSKAFLFSFMQKKA
jgi:hypothetical protein